MTAGLSPTATLLLLRLLEAPELIVSGSVVTGHFGAAGEDLVQHGLLVKAGHDRVVAAPDVEDDVPVMVGPESGLEGSVHFSPARGWLQADSRLLTRYRIDLPRVCLTLLASCDLRPPPRGILELDEGVLWDLGTIRPPRGRRPEVWFARHLALRDTFERLKSAMKRRPSPSLRLILTSAAHHRLPATELPGAVIVPVEDVLSSTSAFGIDLEVLHLRLQGLPDRQATGPLHLTPDNRRLTINGSVTLTFRGKITCMMIRLLVDAHGSGKGWRGPDLLQAAGSSARTVDQAFGERWGEVGRYVKVRDGFWRFEL